MVLSYNSTDQPLQILISYITLLQHFFANNTYPFFGKTCSNYFKSPCFNNFSKTCTIKCSNIVRYILTWYPKSTKHCLQSINYRLIYLVLITFLTTLSSNLLISGMIFRHSLLYQYKLYQMIFLELHDSLMFLYDFYFEILHITHIS